MHDPRANSLPNNEVAEAQARTPQETGEECQSACPNCGTLYRIGIWNFPCKGSGDHKLGTFYTRDPNIHSSERVKLLYNPTTGETRTPGRIDRGIHPKYHAAGFTQYKELETHQEIRQLEKEKGLRHEMSNFDMGSGHAD